VTKMYPGLKQFFHGDISHFLSPFITWFFLRRRQPCLQLSMKAPGDKSGDVCGKKSISNSKFYQALQQFFLLILMLTIIFDFKPAVCNTGHCWLPQCRHRGFSKAFPSSPKIQIVFAWTRCGHDRCNLCKTAHLHIGRRRR